MRKVFSNRVINGNELAKAILQSLRVQVSQSPSCPPTLAILLAGQNVASESYVRKKIQTCNKIGIKYEIYRFEDTDQAVFMEQIRRLNNDSKVTGIIAQLPLPPNYNRQLILSQINPSKDIDCLHPHNLSLLFQYGESAPMLPCTPQAVLHVFDQNNLDLTGKKVVMIGRSDLVGLPLSILMMKRNATVTICHSHSKSHFDQIVGNSDIVVSATGCVNLVKHTKPGAFIIDIGISNSPGTNKIQGDVDRKSVSDFQLLSPSPGGIGPLTVIMLMKNVVKLWKNSK